MDDATGALVSRITPDSPAAGSRLETGDVIIGFNNRPVESTRDLPRMVAKAPVGQSATVKVLRDGKEVTMDAVLASIPETGQTRQMTAPTPRKDRLGLRLVPLNEEARTALGHQGEGVLVEEVMPSSPAARKGLKAGDIILKVGNVTVTSPEDVIKEVKKMKSKEKPVLLLVQRKNNQRYVALKTA
tara:strand:- start:149 stop:706 length:558 start_codon:yes stop_codon:yes gene_type:complete